MLNPSLFLRRAILADALMSGAAGMLLASAAGPLAPLLNLQETLLRETGVFFLVYAALVGFLGTRRSMPRMAVLAVIAANAFWAVASLAFLFGGLAAPNLLGTMFVAAQAFAVGVFAELQYIGLRRSRAAVAASA